MAFLLTQIFACLLAAAALGAVGAWLLRQNMARRRERYMQAKWRERLQQAEADRERAVQRLAGELEKARTAGATGEDPSPQLIGEYEERISRLEEQVAERETALGDQREELKTLRASLTRAETHAGDQERMLQDEIEALAGELAAREQAAERDQAAQLEALQKELSEKSDQLSLLEGRLADAELDAGSHDDRIREQVERALVEAHSERDDALDRLTKGEAALAREREKLEAALAAAQAERDAAIARAEAGQDEAVKAVRSKLEAHISQLQGQLVRRPGGATVAAESSRVRELEDTLAERDKTISSLQQQLEHAGPAAGDDEVARLEEAIRQRDDSIAVLRDDLAALSEDRAIAARGRQDEQLRIAIEEANQWQEKHDRLAATLEDRETRIAELELQQFDRDTGQEQVPGVQGATGPKKTRRKTASRRTSAGNEANMPRSAGERIGSILSRPPGPADNLQEIHGIGPKLEKLLNELGFFHFHQIATLEPADVARLSREIGRFGNRIERDDWISQATALHARYHGDG